MCPAVHINTTSHIHANETNLYEMLCTRSGFEREAKSNLEMAYFPLFVEREIQSELTVWKAQNRVFCISPESHTHIHTLKPVLM